MKSKSYLSGIFGQSPVRPLQRHMEKVAACASELIGFIEATAKQDWSAADEARRKVTTLEHEADDLKTELRLNLPSSLFMPVARADLLDLLTVQDKVANKAKDITGLMTGRRMQIPAPIAPLFQQYVVRSVDAAKQAEKTVNELDELYETGFRGAEVELVQAMIQELDQIENDTDKLQIEVRAALFRIEKELPPVDVMFLYKVIDRIGELADHAQRVGARLQLLIAR